jgi:hypothetical protein
VRTSGTFRAVSRALYEYHFTVFAQCMALVLMGLASHAQTVLFVSGSENSTHAKVQVELASRFYGLDVQNMLVGKPGQSQLIFEALKRPDLLAALITGDALSSLDQTKSFAALRRPGKASVPLVLLDISPTDGASTLSRWSGGGVTGCKVPGHSTASWKLAFSDDKEFTEQLAGIQLPYGREVKCGLALAGESVGTVLVEASSPSEKLPVLVTSFVHSQRVFFASGVYQDERSASGAVAEGLNDAFSNIAPLLVALRYAAGDYAWHAPGHFANLTVDDAWLVEPFGNLDYASLLGEMDKHNFHTSIAFIPWNFDRSRLDVVSLFRGHPERFSVCVHGNNHDHQEFADYSLAPLAEQSANLKQALARMERFTSLTGISYSPVMVFPHSVAPLQTFQELKKYNYWATANSQNVPMGSVAPEDSLFSLRPQTLAFDNFLSLQRYSAELPVSPATVAVNAYLGNPLLFYVHQEFFHGDIGAFDRVADSVNTIEPASQWKSLGDIAQHLYLLRKRESGGYDVLTFSPDFYLANPEMQSVTFHLRKPENFAPAIQDLSRDGESLSYARVRDGISFELVVGAGQSAHIQVHYANDLDLSKISVSKTGRRTRILRWLSDARDLWLTRSSLGLKVSKAYYSLHLDELELRIERWGPIALILSLLSGLLFYLGKARFARSAERTRAAVRWKGNPAIMSARSSAPVWLKRLVWNIKHARPSGECPRSFAELVAARVGNDGSILDIGCGSGSLLVALRKRGWQGRYIGLDISDRAVQAVNALSDSNAEALVSEIEGFSLPPSKVDAICFVESLYYVRAVRVIEVLQRCRGCLNAHGGIYIRMWDVREHEAYVRALGDCKVPIPGTFILQ